MLSERGCYKINKVATSTQWEINLDFLETVCDFLPVNDSKPIENIRAKLDNGIVPKKQLNKAIFHELSREF